MTHNAQRMMEIMQSPLVIPQHKMMKNGCLSKLISAWVWFALTRCALSRFFEFWMLTGHNHSSVLGGLRVTEHRSFTPVYSLWTLFGCWLFVSFDPQISVWSLAFSDLESNLCTYTAMSVLTSWGTCSFRLILSVQSTRPCSRPCFRSSFRRIFMQLSILILDFWLLKLFLPKLYTK